MGKEIIIKGTPLIKTKSEKRIKEFQAGCVYCKTLQYYIDLEKEEGDCVVGDSWEASLPLREAIVFVPDEAYVECVHNTVIPTRVTKDFVFCMTGVKVSAEQGQPLLDEELSKFGTASLLVTDIDEFVTRVQEAAAKEGFSLIRHGFVNYYDERFDNIVMHQDIINSISNIAFWKRKKYEKQSEYRFLFRGETDKDYTKFDIGDITEISCCFTQEQIQKTMVRKHKN